MVNTRAVKRKSTVFNVPPISGGVTKKLKVSHKSAVRTKQPRILSMTDSSKLDTIILGIESLKSRVERVESRQSIGGIIAQDSQIHGDEGDYGEDDITESPYAENMDDEENEGQWTNTFGTSNNDVQVVGGYTHRGARGGGRPRGGRGGHQFQNRGGHHQYQNSRGGARGGGNSGFRFNQGHVQHQHQQPRPHPHPQQGQKSSHRNSWHGNTNFQQNGNSQPQYRSFFSKEQKRELQRMMDRSHVYHKTQDEKAKRELIIDGLPSKRADKFDTEMKKAVEAMTTVMDDFSPDMIRFIDRFNTPSKDGTHPMKLTFWDPEVVNAILKFQRSKPGKFPWLRDSKTRIIRRNNAHESKRVTDLNGGLPDHEAMIWEEITFGPITTKRLVPNPHVLPPSLDIQDRPGVNLRPQWAYPPQYLPQAPVPPVPPMVPQPGQPGAPPPGGAPPIVHHAQVHGQNPH